MKTFIQLSLIGVLLMYLAFSFISWKLNPLCWEQGTRAMLVFISFGWILISGIITAGIEDMKNK